MSPYEKAARWHLEHSPGVAFTEIVEAHFQVGYAFSGPAYFLLGRQVSSTWDDERICDPWQVDPLGDAWHVWLYAGDMRAWQRLVPYSLPWLMFHRRDKLRRYRFPQVDNSQVGSGQLG